MTTATETLISRATSLFEAPLTWALPEPCAALKGLAGLHAMHSFRPDFLALQRMGIPTQDHWPGGKPAVIALTLPRQVEWACGLLAQALERIPPGGGLMAIARNDRGGKRYEALLEEHFEIGWSDSKNHCRAVALARPPELPEAVAAWRRGYALKKVEGTDLVAMPGSFSCEHIDPASALLARCLPPLEGRVADFGAGWGYLSHHLLSSAAPPAHIDLFEADMNALTAAEENLKRWQGRAGFHWHDVLSEKFSHSYDAIVMNPPFHDQLDANPGIGQGFVLAAAKALKAGGKLWMVANKHLPYEDILESSFSSWRRVAEEGGFKVLTGVK
jgi:16S rRNA (guanine1207-N2)-methyltransferase